MLCVAAPSPSAQPVFIESKNRGGALPSASALCVAVPSPSAQPVFTESENWGGALPSAYALCAVCCCALTLCAACVHRILNPSTPNTILLTLSAVCYGAACNAKRSCGALTDGSALSNVMPLALLNDVLAPVLSLLAALGTS